MLSYVLSGSSQIFACDYASIDAEIERLKPLIELGGYIPCPDHRIAPDAEFLKRGHAIHFRCNHPDALGMRRDILR
jgi:hypothetical protein